MRGKEDRKGVLPPGDFTSQAKEARSFASTLVAVPALGHPDWLIEVEAIAVI